MMINDAPVALNPLSEMLALSTFRNTKNVIISVVETRGSLDREAMTLAVARTAEKYPQVLSCIKEVRTRGKYRLLWEHRPDLPLPVNFSQLQPSDDSKSTFDRFIDHMVSRLDRDWDLFKEPVVEYHLVRVAENHYVFGPILHHVASDAAIASEIGRETLANYHEILTGIKPQWACQPEAMSTARKRPVRAKETKWTHYASEGRQAISKLFERPTLPVGSGSPADSRQHQVKREFSPEETARLMKMIADQGVSLIDLLTACSNLAIDQWNQNRGLPRGTLTTSMTVNMKGRFRGTNAENNSALLFFKSNPQQRDNPREFIRSLSLQRIKQFRNQMDLKFFRDVARMNASVSFLPFGPRKRIVNFIMQKHQFSIGITLLGVLWPSYNNGKPTTDSCITQVADMTLLDVFGTGYKLLSSTHLLVIVYFFRNRLNLCFAASACHFTREESEAFIDLVIANIFECGYTSVQL
jgi:hypothetical protein